jgi:hypothetical protein
MGRTPCIDNMDVVALSAERFTVDACAYGVLNSPRGETWTRPKPAASNCRCSDSIAPRRRAYPPGPERQPTLDTRLRYGGAGFVFVAGAAFGRGTLKRDALGRQMLSGH